MFRFLKKTSISKVFTKKRIFWLCVLAVLILLILPIKSALAISLDPRTWLPSIIGMIIRLILKISELTLQMANWFLKVAISNPFGVPLTTPGQAPLGNPIILIGWTLLRDLVNMLFILGLAYIGLVTALNIRKFETGKTFKNLILIAILINFTPVICGVIVDIANIISGFFLQGIDFSALQDIFGRQQQQLKQALGNFTIDNAMVMIKSLVLIGYGFIAAFVIMLYAAIFIVRAPIIWMLVIFSPLAFFAWIFESTRPHYKKWWNLFIQWAMIVIPASFFLYLSQQVLVNSKDIAKFPDTGLMGTLISEIAPYGVALFFLIVGLIIAMGMNKAMSSVAIKGVKFAGAKAKTGSVKIAKKAKQIGGEAAAGVSGATVGFREGFKQRTKAAPDSSRREKMGTHIRNIRGTTGAMAKGGLTKEGREEGRKRVAKALEKRHLRKAGSYEAGRTKRMVIDEKSQKRLESMSTYDQQMLLKRTAITSREKRERAAITGILAKKGEFEVKDKNGKIDHAKEEKFIEESQKLGIDITNLAKSRPDLTPIIRAAEVEQQMMTNLEKKVAAMKQAFMSPAGGGLKEKIAEKRAKREVFKKERMKDDETIKKRVNYYQSAKYKIDNPDKPKMTPEEIEYEAKQDLRKIKRQKVESRIIQEQVGRMTGREFTKNVKSKASLQNVDVVAAMDKTKIRDFARLASREQRQALGNAVKTGHADNILPDLVKQVLALNKAKNHAEAKRIRNIIMTIQASPDFK